jgi:GntR family transcriptional regulator
MPKKLKHGEYMLIENTNPLYLQIKKKLIDKIQSGECIPGDKFPTENELSEEYKVSRSTIRHALDELEIEEIIKRRRGIGTIVSHKKVKPELMKLSGFSNMMLSRGMKPQTKILSLEIVDTPLRVKEGYGNQESPRSWLIKRLLIADDKPIGTQELYIPTEFTFSPDELFGMQSFYAFMREKHNIQACLGKETLTAKPAKKAEANLLQINEGDALLDIWRTTSDENEKVFEVCHILYIADRYEYQIKLYP